MGLFNDNDDKIKNNPFKLDNTGLQYDIKPKGYTGTFDINESMFSDEKEYNKIRTTYGPFASIFYKKTAPSFKDDAVSNTIKSSMQEDKSQIIIAYKDKKTDKDSYISFSSFECPENIEIVRVKEGPSDRYPGGIQTNQTMGDFIDPIEFSGILHGENALKRRNILDKLFRSNYSVTLLIKTNPSLTSSLDIGNIEEINCIVRVFKSKYTHQNWIEYTLKLDPHQDLLDTRISRSPTFDEIPTTVEDIAKKVDEDKKDKTVKYEPEDFKNDTIWIDEKTLNSLNSTIGSGDSYFNKYNCELLVKTGGEITNVEGQQAISSSYIVESKSNIISKIPYLTNGIISYASPIIDPDGDFITSTTQSKYYNNMKTDDFKPTFVVVLKDLDTPGICVKYYLQLDYNKPDDILLKKYLVSQSIANFNLYPSQNANILFLYKYKNDNLLQYHIYNNKKYAFQILSRNYIVNKKNYNSFDNLNHTKNAVYHSVDYMNIRGTEPIIDQFMDSYPSKFSSKFDDEFEKQKEEYELEEIHTKSITDFQVISFTDKFIQSVLSNNNGIKNVMTTDGYNFTRMKPLEKPKNTKPRDKTKDTISPTKPYYPKPYIPKIFRDPEETP